MEDNSHINKNYCNKLSIDYLFQKNICLKKLPKDRDICFMELNEKFKDIFKCIKNKEYNK